MPSITLFITLLENSKAEQQQITIYLHNTQFSGLVTQVSPDSVEIRTEHGRRCFIALDQIVAIETT
jgi:host factor-I protein